MKTTLSLTNRHIVVGVCGGIAAYKSAELVRLLRAAGAEVRVVMTAAAQSFITPLTLQTLSTHRVHTDLLDAEAEQAMGHIELARWADAILIAPATANTLARLANGLCDDLLSTVCLASRAPFMVAPAMNQVMWENRVTQENIARLEAREVLIAGPGVGEQACGEFGPGRMLEPEQLVATLSSLFLSERLAGLSVLITAGPTREALDPVRYLTNHSSGKMGYAVALAAADAGADVTLISGPTHLAVPPGVRRLDVVSASDMHELVMAHASDSDIFVAAAAVADYRPGSVATQKQKKGASHVDLKMVRNVDIVAAVAGSTPAPFTVGFAAETENLATHAQDKRRAKSLDMIAANLVGADQGGFLVDDNALEVFWEGGHKSLPLASKTCLARELIGLIAGHYHARSAA